MYPIYLIIKNIINSALQILYIEYVNFSINSEVFYNKKGTGRVPQSKFAQNIDLFYG